MVRLPAPAQQGSGKFGQVVGWVTRAVTVAAVAIQAALLAVEVSWAVRNHVSLAATAGRQGGLFAATLVLAGAAFWLTAQTRAADPLVRLRRSPGLRLAAIRITEIGG